MTLPHLYGTALALTILTMLCWGSWANVLKIAKGWRFELLYYDYSIGVALAAALAGLVKLQAGPDALPRDAKVVVLATGHGLKDIDAPLGRVRIPEAVEPRLEALRS